MQKSHGSRARWLRGHGCSCLEAKTLLTVLVKAKACVRTGRLNSMGCQCCKQPFYRRIGGEFACDTHPENRFVSFVRTGARAELRCLIVPFHSSPSPPGSAPRAGGAVLSTYFSRLCVLGGRHCVVCVCLCTFIFFFFFSFFSPFASSTGDWRLGLAISKW